MAETSLQCPQCDKKYRVKDAKPGAVYKCKECGVKLGEPELGFADEPKPRIWEIPVRLGRYIIDGEVARGGMGVIYKGRQEGLDRVVAIKMMLPGPAGDAELSQRFSREARAAASLRHPNIVAVHEIGEYNGQPFFTMDYVDGRPLDKVFFDGPMKPERGAEILREVARGIQFAHEKGIIHRDLKPGNIMIDKEGVPRVTDFGLAKAMDSQSMLSVTGEVLGTPSYMSPEQAEGRIHEIDARSDVYSLGAILYRILTGRVPFEGATMAATIYKVVHEYTTEPIKLNRLLPPDLSAICMKALEKERKDRYWTAGDLADDLDRFVRGEPVQARPLSKVKLLQRRLKKHKTAATVVAGVAALALVAIVAVYFLVRKSEVDLVAANLRDPALRMNAIAALFDKLPQWSGSDRSRGEKLALEVMADKDPKVREVVIAAFEKQQLTGWSAGHEGLAKWLDDPSPERVIRYFAAVKERAVVDKMVRLLRSPSKTVKLEAVRYFKAVPDARAFYALGMLITDRDCGEEARQAIQRLYIDKVLAVFNPAAGNVGGSLSELGNAIDKHNKEIEDIMNQDGGGPKDEVELSIALLKASDPPTRMKAAYELGERGDARAKEPLFAALTDEDDGVARMAGEAFAPFAKEVVARLIPMLRHARAIVRRNAAFLLGRSGDKSAVPALELADRDERDEEVKGVILDARQALRK